MYAYNVRDYQVSGGPGWANSETYDIVAKADGNAIPPLAKLMLQALLKDRFKLALQHGTKDAPIYELVVAKADRNTRGHNVARVEVKIRQNEEGRGPKGFHWRCSLDLLGTLSGRPVVDKTGLPSTYTFKLDWTPGVGEGGLPWQPPPDVIPPDSNGPSLFTALQEQLRLRSNRRRVRSRRSLVIEEAEKPTEN